MPNVTQKTRIRAAKAANEVGGMVTRNNRPLIVVDDDMAFSPVCFRAPLGDIPIPPSEITTEKSIISISSSSLPQSTSLSTKPQLSRIKIADKNVPDAAGGFEEPKDDELDGWAEVSETRDSSAYLYRKSDWVVKRRGKNQIHPSATCRNTSCDEFQAMEGRDSTRWRSVGGKHFKAIACKRCFAHYKQHSTAWPHVASEAPNKRRKTVEEA